MCIISDFCVGHTAWAPEGRKVRSPTLRSWGPEGSYNSSVYNIIVLCSGTTGLQKGVLLILVEMSGKTNKMRKLPEGSKDTRPYVWHQCVIPSLHSDKHIKSMQFVIFPIIVFSKMYFPEVYFLKVYSPKVYFSKVYISKVYFCEMYPTCVTSKLYEFIKSTIFKK